MITAFDVPGFSRRVFLGTAAAAAGSAMLPVQAAPAAKYTRYNVTSPQGQAMLVSYDKGITKLLSLPPADPRNWFRYSFIHTMDCPHGNWWFFVWHRPFVGYFEQIVREASGNPKFAFPYWDWTQLPAHARDADVRRRARPHQRRVQPVHAGEDFNTFTSPT